MASNRDWEGADEGAHEGAPAVLPSTVMVISIDRYRMMWIVMKWAVGSKVRHGQQWFGLGAALVDCIGKLAGYDFKWGVTC
jgi:hypothetical protein